MLQSLRRLISALLPFALAAVFLASPAKAEWFEASSDHFVIYADDSEKDIRAYAENLEKYHQALEYLVGKRLDKPSPSNRVVIFAVGTQGELRKIFGNGSANVAGFYIPRAGASRAFVQDIRNQNGYPDFSTVVLLHEYAHHFLISSSRFEMPRWMSEGMAEFFSAAGFPDSGGVLIGRPAQHRAGELSRIVRFDVEGMLQRGSYDARREQPGDAFYGRSWMLYHYLRFTPARTPQIGAYLSALLQGKSSMEAGEIAFGDLRELEKELMAYKRQRRFAMLEIPASQFEIGPIALRRLPEGEAAAMDVRIRSQRGISGDKAAELAAEARALAARYPGDPGVLTALAEAEFDAGFDDAAVAAADRAIALDRARVNAYVQKGFALFRKARNAPDDARGAAFTAALEPFTALNQIENDHPLPLLHYYRSFTERGVTPPEDARHALERAAILAPFDKRLWFQVAMLQSSEGKIGLARQSLQPIAYAPHGGSGASQARKIMDALEKVPEGQPLRISPRSAIQNGIDGGEDDDAAEGDDDSAAGGG